MFRYTRLSRAAGENLFEACWGFVLKPLRERLLVPDSSENCFARDCWVFRRAHRDGPLEIFFSGESDTADVLLEGNDETRAMLYGDYDRAVICKLRILGMLSRVLSPQKIQEIKRALRQRKNEPSSLGARPVYRFTPIEYACSDYEPR